MKWDSFLSKVGNAALIDAENLLAGESDVAKAKGQLSRWQKTGKLIQLKRGYYVLAEPYRRTVVNHYFIANLLKWPSYISLEKALEFYRLIPDVIGEYSSVTTKRANRFRSEVGSFRYWHIKPELLWGYQQLDMNGQSFFIAFPEKALLDLIYLRGMKISKDYLENLRLQNLETINCERLQNFAERFNSPGMHRAGKIIIQYVKQDLMEQTTL